MGKLKYGQTMTRMLYVRTTTAQCSSVTAIAASMGLTTGDVLRAAFDEYLEDLDEAPIFTSRFRLALGPAVSKPRR